MTKPRPVWHLEAQTLRAAGAETAIKAATAASANHEIDAAELGRRIKPRAAQA